MTVAPGASVIGTDRAELPRNVAHLVHSRDQLLLGDEISVYGLNCGRTQTPQVAPDGELSQERAIWGVLSWATAQTPIKGPTGTT